MTDDGRLDGKVFFLGHDVFMDLMVRVEGDPLMMAGPVEDAVLEVDAGLPLGAVASLGQLARESNAMPRFYALMVGLFAAFSLLMTAVGLYGVVTTAAARRTREIGIRMALGATTRQVRGLLISQIVGPVTVGLAFGAAGTVALTRVLGALLYGMNPVDPLTFAAVAGLLLSVVLLATYLPAHRASRLEPTPALRAE
jgi:ABC-type antimicrobial peptide transport system permease subunit